jgi:hypothetical protein
MTELLPADDQVCLYHGGTNKALTNSRFAYESDNTRFLILELTELLGFLINLVQTGFWVLGHSTIVDCLGKLSELDLDGIKIVLKPSVVDGVRKKEIVTSLICFLSVLMLVFRLIFILYFNLSLIFAFHILIR